MSKRAIFGLWLILIIGLQSPGFGQTAREYYFRASSLYVKGDLAGAVNNARAALELDPGYRPAWELKNTALREQSVLSLIMAEEKSRQVKKYLADGIRDYQAGDYSAAVESFRRVLILSPDNKDALACLNNIQNVTRAEEAARRRLLGWWMASVAVGYLAVAALLAFLLIKLKRRLAKWLERPVDHLVCPNCQAKLPLKEEFCPNCGTRVGLKLWRAVSEEQKRWYDRIGWKENPFSLDIHPEYFTGYQKECREILAKISARSGHILITGPLGIGKTTLLRWLAKYLPPDLAPVYVSRPPQDFSQLIRHIVDSLGSAGGEVPVYDIYHLDQLRKKLGKGLILLLDEAHEFTLEIERPLRTLGDLDGVNLVMAGFPETAAKIKDEIKPLYDRLVLAITLDHLEFAELSELLKARIEGAGGKGTYPFTASALTRIDDLSQGNPRVALKLADAAVALAINQGEDKISDQLVKEINL
jgi:type II secretory pathway predicted ATPase ExeA/ribosomal protein L40E